MDVVIGSLILPRSTVNSGKPGEVFFVRVLASVASGIWLVESAGQRMTVSTGADLHVGDLVALKLANRSVIPSQKLSPAESPSPPVPRIDQAFVAFVSQGLPLVPHHLKRLHRWMEEHRSSIPPSETLSWGSAIAARDWPELGPGAELLEAWLAWENALAQGSSNDPPDTVFWELWNGVKGRGGTQQLGVPFQWECESQIHWALLKAEVTTSPAGSVRFSVLTNAWGTGFRIGWEPDGKNTTIGLRVFDGPVHDRLALQWKDLSSQLRLSSGDGFHFILEAAGDPQERATYRPGTLNEEA